MVPPNTSTKIDGVKGRVGEVEAERKRFFFFWHEKDASHLFLASPGPTREGQRGSSTPFARKKKMKDGEVLIGSSGEFGKGFIGISFIGEWGGYNYVCW
jgi:hypothetical protein